MSNSNEKEEEERLIEPFLEVLKCQIFKSTFDFASQIKNQIPVLGKTFLYECQDLIKAYEMISYLVISNIALSQVLVIFPDEAKQDYFLNYFQLFPEDPVAKLVSTICYHDLLNNFPHREFFKEKNPFNEKHRKEILSFVSQNEGYCKTSPIACAESAIASDGIYQQFWDIVIVFLPTTQLLHNWEQLFAINALHSRLRMVVFYHSQTDSEYRLTDQLIRHAMLLSNSSEVSKYNNREQFMTMQKPSGYFGTIVHSLRDGNYFSFVFKDEESPRVWVYRKPPVVAPPVAASSMVRAKRSPLEPRKPRKPRKPKKIINFPKKDLIQMHFIYVCHHVISIRRQFSIDEFWYRCLAVRQFVAKFKPDEKIWLSTQAIPAATVEKIKTLLGQQHIITELPAPKTVRRVFLLFPKHQVLNFNELINLAALVNQINTLHLHGDTEEFGMLPKLTQLCYDNNTALPEIEFESSVGDDWVHYPLPEYQARYQQLYEKHVIGLDDNNEGVCMMAGARFDTFYQMFLHIHQKMKVARRYAFPKTVKHRDRPFDRIFKFSRIGVFAHPFANTLNIIKEFIPDANIPMFERYLHTGSKNSKEVLIGLVEEKYKEDTRDLLSRIPDTFNLKAGSSLCPEEAEEDEEERNRILAEFIDPSELPEDFSLHIVSFFGMKQKTISFDQLHPSQKYVWWVHRKHFEIFMTSGSTKQSVYLDGALVALLSSLNYTLQASAFQFPFLTEPDPQVIRNTTLHFLSLIIPEKDRFFLPNKNNETESGGLLMFYRRCGFHECRKQKLTDKCWCRFGVFGSFGILEDQLDNLCLFCENKLKFAPKMRWAFLPKMIALKLAIIISSPKRVCSFIELKDKQLSPFISLEIKNVK